MSISVYYEWLSVIISEYQWLSLVIISDHQWSLLVTSDYQWLLEYSEIIKNTFVFCSKSGEMNYL